MDGRYRILQEIGSGGYATIYRARNILSHKLFALKFEDVYNGNSQTAEGSILARLRDISGEREAPVVELHEHLTVNMDDNDYLHILVLELLSTSLSELSEHMRRQDCYKAQCLSTRSLRSVTRSAVEAVRYVHSRQVMHRDISPANFMFTRYCSKTHVSTAAHDRRPRGDPVDILCHDIEAGGASRPQLKLIDFGSACTFADANGGGATYPLDARPPEQVLGLPMTYKADIWALGCTIFHLVMLTNVFHVDHFNRDNKQDIGYVQSIIEAIGPMPEAMLSSWKNRGSISFSEPLSDPLQQHIAQQRPRDMTDLEVKMFEDLMRSMLQWPAADRPDAQEILLHPWLQLDGES